MKSGSVSSNSSNSVHPSGWHGDEHEASASVSSHESAPSWQDRVVPWFDSLSLERPTVANRPAPEHRVRFARGTAESSGSGKATKCSTNRDATIQENANKSAQALYAQHKGEALPEETIQRFKSGEYARLSEGSTKDRKKEGKLALKAYAAMAEDASSKVYVHKAHKDNTPRLSLR